MQPASSSNWTLYKLYNTNSIIVEVLPQKSDPWFKTTELQYVSVYVVLMVVKVGLQQRKYYEDRHPLVVSEINTSWNKHQTLQQLVIITHKLDVLMYLKFLFKVLFRCYYIFLIGPSHFFVCDMNIEIISFLMICWLQWKLLGIWGFGQKHGNNT